MPLLKMKSSIMFIVFSIVALMISLLISPIGDSILNLAYVGSGFTSLTVCSGYFVSTRDVKTIYEHELDGISAMLFHFEIDKLRKSVVAYPKYIGYPKVFSIYVDSKVGCRRVDNIDTLTIQNDTAAESFATITKLDDEFLQSFINFEFTDIALVQNQSRAIVVLQHGKVVAEGYQTKLGIHEGTPLLGWSMTKSLHSILVGVAMQKGMLNLSTPAKLFDFSDDQKNAIIKRNNGKLITIGDMLNMIDFIEFDENYEIHGSCPAMLFRSFDAAKYAATISVRSILDNALHDAHISKDYSYDWYYSSGVSNILAKELRSYFASDQDYWSFPLDSLFTPLGISSFTIQTDPSGTFVASSFSYGSARSWALLGQLLLQKGKWNGVQLIPESFVEFIQIPHPYSGGHYGGGFWLNPARVDVKTYNYLDHDHPKKVFQSWMTKCLPSDAFLMSGYDGQYVLVVPSLDTVIVRLGFTHDSKPNAWNKSDFFCTITNHIALTDNIHWK